MEADLSLYTEDQIEKINELRKKAESDKEMWKRSVKSISHNDSFRESCKIKIGSHVFVSFCGKTISGKVIRAYDKKKTFQYTRTKVQSRKFLIYDVLTPLGEISVFERDVIKRDVDDVSNVVIPEELKKLSTQTLLHYLNSLRTYDRDEEEYYNGCKYTYLQLKAELALRPHIETKGERAKFNAFKKANKKIIKK